ncbi:MAG TPA: hypothetical protein VF275_06915 [Gammaproteobacteria bacterium]
MTVINKHDNLSSPSVPRKHFVGVCVFASVLTVYALSVTFAWIQPLVITPADTRLSFEERLASGETLSVEQIVVAAEAGNAIAQRLLGDAYGKGQGMAIDLPAAFGWYLAAAEQGDAAAQAAVAAMYAYGRGVKQDYAQAAEWSARSAANAPPENPAGSAIKND